jgi:hypothetical protein
MQATYPINNSSMVHTTAQVYTARVTIEEATLLKLTKQLSKTKLQQDSNTSNVRVGIEVISPRGNE